jgi:hypothetical protein
MTEPVSLSVVVATSHPWPELERGSAFRKDEAARTLLDCYRELARESVPAGVLTAAQQSRR